MAGSPAPPSGQTAPPPPPPVPVPDLAEMQPTTPTEVVEWARRHLGLDRSFVVARAVEYEPDQERRRQPAQLQALWKDLVAHMTRATVEVGQVGSGTSVEPGQVGSGTSVEVGQVGSGTSVEPAPEEPGTVDGFDLADLDDLAEAPSHAHDIEQKIKATFPGAELTMLPPPTDDTGGGA